MCLFRQLKSVHGDKKNIKIIKSYSKDTILHTREHILLMKLCFVSYVGQMKFLCCLAMNLSELQLKKLQEIPLDSNSKSCGIWLIIFKLTLTEYSNSHSLNIQIHHILTEKNCPHKEPALLCFNHMESP